MSQSNRWTVALLTTVAAAAACGGEVKTYVLPPEPPPQPPPAPAAPPRARGFENPGGMWLPSQLGSAHAETLKKLGLELDPARLSDPMAEPLGAIVSLGGCSASFVSPEGLVITNHHCVTGALQYNSTPEKNLLENGMVAATLADEPTIGPTGRVYVTQAFQDVTDRMRQGLDRIADDKARHDTLEKREKEIVAECEAAKENVRCDVANYFGGAHYLVVERLEIKDVRLVYAPAEGIGNFGGEVDNWRWPRHTGDFAFYRAYVRPDGKPGEYAKDNVPYRPRQHLKLPDKPLAAGDLVFVAGYPGRTYRLYTADETEQAVDFYYPYRIRFCEELLSVIEKIKKNDTEAAIKATPLERGLSNTLTYTKGALEGLSQGGAAEQRRNSERELEDWVKSDAKWKAQADVFDKLRAAFAEQRKTRELDALLGEMLRIPSLLGAAFSIVRMAEERPKADAERDPEYQQRNWQRLEQGQQALEKRYFRKLDIATLSEIANRAKRLLSMEQRALLLKPLTGQPDPTPEQITAAAERLYAKTTLEKTPERVRLLKKATSAQLRASPDPLLRLAVALRPIHEAQEKRDDALSGKLTLLRPVYVQALREHSTAPVAPDANGTLRVTYGTVRGYRPKPDADPYVPFTTLSQVVQKHTGKEPFDAPKKLLDAHAHKRFGPWVDAKLGEVPVDFLADLDITGGNSGSATLNGRGELVGLAFDGNYEAMASDWLFMPEITRSIHVDIRYALWVMDAVDGADRVMKEMGVEPAIP